MQYTVLLYADATLGVGPEHAEWAASLPAHTALNEAARERGYAISGAPLFGADAATSVRRRNGERLVTEGPFAETKEQLWGFYLIDAPDLDAVLDLVDGLWEVDHGTVEIRPVLPVPTPA
jgi:hypothetical protein